MKTKEFIAIEQKLMPSLPGFAIKGALMFMRPIQQVLKGICFEGSSFDKTSFYANYFVMLLCVPRKYISFGFGDRLRIDGADRWSVNDPNFLMRLTSAIHQEALPYFARVQGTRDICELARLRANPRDPYVMEAIAYSLARAGDDRAIAKLDDLVNALDNNISWQSEMGERAQALRKQLAEDSSLGQQQLRAWEVESLKNLGLDGPE